jgi:branched-chain amino acid transport system substrate-binding protein
MKKMPTSIHAGVYSSTLQYLKAVQTVGTDDPDAVMAQLKKQKINDMYAKGGYVRQDGRMIHEMYLMQVKKPSESKYPWDYYIVKTKIPGEQAYQPLSLSRCPLIKK